MTNKVQHNKKSLISALQKTLGVVTSACEKVGVSRWTFYNYYKDDKDFKIEVDDVKNIALDFAESKLLKNIESGKEVSILFFLKTQGKARGYIERSEAIIEVKETIDYSNMTTEELTKRAEALNKLNDSSITDTT